MKYILSFLISFLCITAKAADTWPYYEVNGMKYNVSDSKLLVGKGGDVRIPDIIGIMDYFNNHQTYAIRHIGNRAFYNIKDLTSIEISGGIVDIGSEAFEGCTNIVVITSLRSTPPEAKDNSFDATVYQKATLYVPEESFEKYCTTYPWSDFQNIQSINTKGIKFSCDNSNKTAKVIGYDEKKISEHSIIPQKIKYNNKIYTVININNEAFKDCTELSSIKIPDNVTNIGKSAFSGCKNLAKVYINDIAAWCKIKFERADANPLQYAKELYLNGNIVKDLVVPDSVTSIGDYVFSGYTQLTSVNIPNSVTAVGDETFKGCTNLSKIYSACSNPPSTGDLCFYNVNATLYVPHESVLLYEMEKGWKDLSIQSDAAGLKYNYDTSNMTATVAGIEDKIPHVTIPKVTKYQDKTYNVVAIGNNAFQNFSTLKSITIANTVTSIGNNAFAGCSGLTSIDIANTVTSIGDNAFAECSGLTSVNINDLAAWCNIKFNNEKANPLYCAHNLYLNGEKITTQLVIPDNVTDISNYAFAGCTDLTSIYSFNQTPPSLQNYGFDKSHYRYVKVYVPQQSVQEYRNKNWYQFANLNAYNDLGLEFSYDTNNKTAAVKGFNKDKLPSNLTIPATTIYLDETYTVNAISDNAFYNCTGLTSVDIPNSVTNIGSSAFLNCTGLTSVDIPNSVTNIGEYAFYNCTGLTSVDIPNSVTNIGEWAFSGCKGLTSVTIPNSIKNINNNTFRGCSSLASIDIPNSVTNIGEYAFYNCSSLTQLVIPNNVTDIGIYAFYNCTGITSVDIPDGMLIIEKNTFQNCSGLTSITIPKSVRSIERYAFAGCNNLASVYSFNPIPPNVADDNFSSANYQNATLCVLNEAVEEYKTAYPWNEFLNIKNFDPTAFYFEYDDGNMTATITGANKDKLSSELVIPRITTYNGKTYTVVAIGEETFKDCDGVTEVTIPNCIMSIGMDVFDGCSSLTKVNISDLAAWCNIKFIHYASNPLSFAHHLYLNGEEVKDLVIPDGVTSIGDCAFYGCSSLTSVAIPNSVTSIGGSSFNGCSGLPSVVIPNSVKSIRDFAFNGCSGLHNVTIPNSVTYIGGAAFQTCYRLTNVTIHNGVTKIGGFTFSGCNSLRSVSIPNSVTSIGEYAFQGCSSLTSVEISNSVTAIDKAAFRGCLNLKEVYSLNPTPPTTSTDKDPFSDDIYQNAKLYVPEEALEAYRNAEYWKNFRNIQGFESPIFYFDYDDNKMTATIAGVNENKISSEIVIPETTTHFGKTYAVVAIGDNAFRDCSSVISVTIPNSIMTIGESALWNCSGLTSITIPSSVTSIGRYSFVGCYSLTEVYSFNLTPPNVYSDRKELFLSSTYQKATLYVPEEALEAYRNAECWKKFQNIKNVESSPLYYFNYNDDDMTATITRVNKNNLSSEIVIPETTTYNGKTYTVVAIGDEAFKDCSSITSVTIPNSVTSIGWGAFYHCSGLTSVTLPDGVTSIGHSAFIDCNSLSLVYSLNLTPPSTGTDKDPFDDRIYKEVTLYVPEEALTAYKNAEYWKNFQNIKGFDPTGIKGIEADGNDKRNVYYDLNGRRLNAPRKGLNIINGKKVIIK